jgi:Protein of unknown function (DUF2867)
MLVRSIFKVLRHTMNPVSPTILIQTLPQAPQDSLLNGQLNDTRNAYGHSDFFYCVVTLPAALTPQQVLSRLLDAFVSQPPSGVGRLMRFRNVLVKPLGLRTATLGCPVSSLMGKADSALFDDRFPVLAQAHTAQDAQVILGADDKHLKFRSCAAVQRLPSTAASGGNQWRISLGTRVHYNNWFGQFYMTAIDAVHRRYVAPTMLRTAVAAMLVTVQKSHF